MAPPPLHHLSDAEVRRALSMPDTVAAMRDAFTQLARGQVSLPTRQQVDASDENGTALIMACHSSTLKLFSVKIATVYKDNPRRHLPTVQSLLTLTDAETGTPLATMDAASLTAIRTGAASGLATDLLARRDATTLALFGTGTQAQTQLEAVCCVRNIARCRVYGRDSAKTEAFTAEMSRLHDLPVEAANSPAAALAHADIICTATSSSIPVFDDGDVPPGAHINAIGAYRPDMAEIPSATVCRARVVVDHHASAMEEAGDLLAPLREGTIDDTHFATELGDVLLGEAPGRSSEDQITLFKSVGIAIQDLCAATRVLQIARQSQSHLPAWN